MNKLPSLLVPFAVSSALFLAACGPAGTGAAPAVPGALPAGGAPAGGIAGGAPAAPATGAGGAAVPAGGSVGSGVATPPASGRTPFETQCDAAMLQLINKERAAKGAGPVQIDNRLAQAAFNHAFDMYSRNYLDHVTKGTEGQRAENFGYQSFPSEAPGNGVWGYHRAAKAGFPMIDMTLINENVADVFQRDDPQGLAQTCMDEYRQSEGHWSNLLNPQWNLTGVSTIYRIDGAPRDNQGQAKISNCQLFARM